MRFIGLVFVMVFGVSFSSGGHGEDSWQGISQNCEIFIHQLEATQYGYGVGVKLFLKVTPSQLDGTIKRVGFHYQRIFHFGGNKLLDWQTTELKPYGDLEDTWSLPLYFSTEEDYYVGAFFVETESGAYFWTLDQDGELFIFDLKLYLKIMDTYECRKEDGLWKAKVDTLGADFSYLNPQGCF